MMREKIVAIFFDLMVFFSKTSCRRTGSLRLPFDGSPASIGFLVPCSTLDRSGGFCGCRRSPDISLPHPRLSDSTRYAIPFVMRTVPLCDLPRLSDTPCYAIPSVMRTVPLCDLPRLSDTPCYAIPFAMCDSPRSVTAPVKSRLHTVDFRRQRLQDVSLFPFCL